MYSNRPIIVFLGFLLIGTIIFFELVGIYFYNYGSPDLAPEARSLFATLIWIIGGVGPVSFLHLKIFYNLKIYQDAFLIILETFLWAGLFIILKDIPYIWYPEIPFFIIEIIKIIFYSFISVYFLWFMSFIKNKIVKR